ncbi:hypothetical protein KEM54_001035 [Ascosphaera aggregata]|nr:hypothetical protein KEM54_001035 [Ascosphaera aggregata]
MKFELFSLLALASLALAKPEDIKNLGEDIGSDLEGIGSDIVDDAETAWKEFESHLPTFHYPSSVIEAIETGVKGVPGDVKSAVRNGEDVGKAIFDNVRSDVLKHSTLPGWIHSLPTEAQHAFSTDLAKAKSEAEKIEATVSTALVSKDAATSTSDNGAPRQTYMIAGAAGVFGIVGLAAAL